MGRLFSLLLIVLPLTVYAQKSVLTFNLDLPVNTYDIDGETIHLHSKITKEKMNQKKLVRALKNVRKEFLKFTDQEEFTYSLSHPVHIYVLENFSEWEKFNKKRDPSAETKVDPRGFYNEENIYLAAYDMPDDAPDPPIEDIVVHEYVHHLLFMELKTTYKQLSGEFPYMQVPFEWITEGVPQYLTGKVLYRNAIPDAHIAYLKGYKNEQKKFMGIWEIMTSPKHRPLPGQSLDSRHYWYATALFNFLIEQGHRDKISECLLKVYKLDSMYVSSLQEIFVEEAGHAPPNEFEKEFQDYLLKITN
jgi:hypothetical protein